MSLKRFSIFFFAIFYGVAIQAANPNGYYDAITGKKTQALKTALSNLLLNHTVLDYNSLWGYFPSTDARPNGTVWDMYSSTVRSFGSTSGMNREHSFPKSWWGGAVLPAYTDINHLYPSDGDANMAKSNYPLGEVGTAIFNNGVTKVGYNIFPGYSTTSNVFEPADEYKGDFARTYFYMVTCYQNYTWSYQYMVEQNQYPTLKSWASNLLMKWHRLDPVSTKEINRNEAVFKIQNNRNPFIDYPQLAEYLWGDSTAYNFGLATAPKVPTLATPTNDTRLDFGVSLVGVTKTKTLYVKGSNLTYPLTIFMIASDDYIQFASAVNTVTKDQANTGYNVTFTYKPTSIGTHVASYSVLDGGLIGSVDVKLWGRTIPLDSLKAPVPMVASAITPTAFSANWNLASFADTYCLQLYSVANGQASLIRTIDSIPDNTYDITGLDSGKNYSYTLKSRIGNVLSAESTEMPVSLLTGILAATDARGLSVYTSGSVIFVQAPIEGMSVELFDFSGRKVATMPATGHIQSFEKVPVGLYVVRCNHILKKIMVF
ncbi:MAG TPA: endonuclease [Bacteroidales bacterium]|nr:endonuclease [Bacteroidales bacterium]